MTFDRYPCPVCGYPDLPKPPLDMSYEICPSCGTEFGYSDFAVSVEERHQRHRELMVQWLQTGPKWQAEWMEPPQDWDPRTQILEHLAPMINKNTTRRPVVQLPQSTGSFVRGSV